MQYKFCCCLCASAKVFHIMESIRFQKTFKSAQVSLLTKNLHMTCCPYILPYVIILNGAAQQEYTYKLATKIPFTIINYDYPFSTPAENAVNKRIIEHHTPTTLSSVKPPFLWCVSGITTKNFTANYCQRTQKSYTARHVSGTEIINKKCAGKAVCTL